MDKKFLEALKSAVEFIDDGIHIIDASGKIIYYNQAAKELDEVDVDKAIGRHILEVYPSLDIESSTLLQVMKTCKPIYNVEQNFTNYKGNVISTINTSLPIVYNSKIIGAVEISKNITRVKELSEEIVKLKNAMLEPKKQSNQKQTTQYTFLDIVGNSKEIHRLKALGLKAAAADSPVLVAGPTGTGKELMVQSIHSASKRKNKPFIAQNCAAIPANLLESILFGSVKGSFTGAENRAGLFELANGGTLFLDEINSMPIELQAKLLRVIQDGNLRRVGSTSTVNVDVRIISAINVPIDSVVSLGQIRQDLFYRLSVITLDIPRLSKRVEDIPPLVSYFIDKFNRKYGKHFSGVSDQVMGLFFEYEWPGNVRELEHTLESAISLYDGELIHTEHLPYQYKGKLQQAENQEELTSIYSLKEAMDQYEADIIHKVMQNTDNNISKAAKLLNIPRQTLQYKLKKLNK